LRILFAALLLLLPATSFEILFPVLFLT